MLKKIGLVIGCVLLSLAAHADVFLVQKVPVDVTSDSSTHARDEALSLAQRQAFETLVQRITRAEDVQQLQWPEAKDIVNWVSDVSMSNEKTSPVRYMADVNVRFDADKIKTWLEEKKVPYMAQVMQPAWVVPIYRGAEAGDSTTNPWVQAWETTYNSEIVPLSVVSDDSFDEEQPAAPTFIATAIIYPNKVQVQFKPDSSSNTLLSSVSIIHPLSLKQDVPWKKLVQKTQKQLEKMWLDKNIVRFDKPTFISVIVPIKDLSEWVKVREHLDKIKLIKKYDVRAMRKDQAQIDVYFAGQLDVFIKAMDQENLFLSAVPGNDFWILRNKQTVSEEEKRVRSQSSQQILFPVVVGDEAESEEPKVRLREPEKVTPSAVKMKSAQPQAETKALMAEDESL